MSGWLAEPDVTPTLLSGLAGTGVNTARDDKMELRGQNCIAGSGWAGGTGGQRAPVWLSDSRWIAHATGCPRVFSATIDMLLLSDLGPGSRTFFLDVLSATV